MILNVPFKSLHRQSKKSRRTPWQLQGGRKEVNKAMKKADLSAG